MPIWPKDDILHISVLVVACSGFPHLRCFCRMGAAKGIARPTCCMQRAHTAAALMKPAQKLPPGTEVVKIVESAQTNKGLAHASSCCCCGCDVVLLGAWFLAAPQQFLNFLCEPQLQC